MATFISTNEPQILAELSNGQIIQCKATLYAEGEYREWRETAPCEWMHSWTESEQEIDEESITVLDAYEYEPTTKEARHCEDECNEDAAIQNGTSIKRIIEVLEEVEWEVQDGWESDCEPDWDSIAKELRNEVA